MITFAKTLTMTTLAVFVAILVGVWLASTSPAISSAQGPALPMSVDVRLGTAELAICDGQAWPHFTNGCAAWIAASSDSNGIDRTVSLTVHHADLGLSVAAKAQPLELAGR